MYSEKDISLWNENLVPKGYRLVVDESGSSENLILLPLEWKVQETKALNKARKLDLLRRMGE